MRTATLETKAKPAKGITTKRSTKPVGWNNSLVKACAAAGGAAMSAADRTVDLTDYLTPAQFRRLTKLAKAAGWKTPGPFLDDFIKQGAALMFANGGDAKA